ncbi:secreted RxLR effector protein 161-like [Aegilops tauschii subsp. strangulata]|uniref:Reverse transcriptase Ty1/copia-type domain-containing protein n=1 Tax=Aegilops tauschii subsp. strangulata TaxID=200361 RepID=A0A452XTJ6_AEGTS|nr:secreted RxLR effector protein 161-like [Aegilops tauschii subsp. strangulata]
MEPHLKLSKESTSSLVDRKLYRSVVGNLRYLVHTRPDISFAVGFVSRFMEVPTTEHWAAVKHLIRYVAGTLNYGCRYKKGEPEPRLVGYNKADFAGDVDDRKSPSGLVFVFGGSVISRQLQKQKVITLSSCEAEYITTTTAACTVVWLGRMLGDLLGDPGSGTPLLIDDESVIQLYKNHVFHNRTKHIETRFHFNREHVRDGRIAVDHVHTGEQLANIMTKASPRVKFQELQGMIDIHS